MPGVASGSVLKTVDSRETRIYCALVANNTAPGDRITPLTFTNSTTAVTAATNASMTLVSTSAPDVTVQVGQYLAFKDNSGTYLARVRTNYTGGTTLALTCTEDIPASATAEWPTKVDLVETHSLPTQTATNNVSTYDHTGQGEVSRGDTTRSLTFSCRKSFYSAGQETLVYGGDNENDVYWEVRDPNPDADTFTTPPIRSGTAIISDFSETGNNGEKLGYDFTLNITGSIIKTDPA